MRQDREWGAELGGSKSEKVAKKEKTTVKKVRIRRTWEMSPRFGLVGVMQFREGKNARRGGTEPKNSTGLK